jgi:hypothetical protein
MAWKASLKTARFLARSIDIKRLGNVSEAMSPNTAKLITTSARLNPLSLEGIESDMLFPFRA